MLLFSLQFQISCQDLPPPTSEQTQLKLKTKTNISPQQNSITAAFSPIVTATCRAGIMTVKVETLNKFFGVVQSRDYRKPQCSGYGENARITFLRINMLATTSDEDYCGIFINEVNVFCNSHDNTQLKCLKYLRDKHNLLEAATSFTMTFPIWGCVVANDAITSVIKHKYNHYQC